MDSAYSRSVKTLSVDNGVLTIGLRDGTSVNFNNADLTGVSVGTSGGGSVYPIDAGGKSVGIGKTVYIPINGVNSLTYNADTKKIGVTCDIYLGDGVKIKQETIGVDATSAYNAGYNDVTVSLSSGTPTYGQTSIDITSTAKLSNGKTKDLPIGINVSKYVPSYIKRTAYSINNKTVTVEASNSASVQTTYSKDISASEIYDAGYKAGQNSMGVTRSGNKVSVGVSDTKSITASVKDTHQAVGTNSVSIDGHIYWSGVSLTGSAWINWS